MAELFNYRAHVVRVIDGDTVDFDVDLGFHVWIRIRTRVMGINSPERGQPGWQEATNYMRSLLPIQSIVKVSTHKDPTDKYGRWLAQIMLLDGRDVARAMLDAGHAVPLSF